MYQLTISPRITCATHFFIPGLRALAEKDRPYDGMFGVQFPSLHTTGILRSLSCDVTTHTTAKGLH